MIYYDRYGRPIGVKEFDRLVKDRKYQQIGYTHVEGVLISTVWLGIDHNFRGGPPLIFETMGDDGDGLDLIARYHDLVAARIGHKRIVKAVREGRSMYLDDLEQAVGGNMTRPNAPWK